MIIHIFSTQFETDNTSEAPSDEESCPLISDSDNADKEREPEKKPQPYSEICKVFATLSVISITGSSTLLEENFARNFITLLSSLIILIPYQNAFLSSRPLTYLGDISYCLYLVYWPVYAYWKLQEDSKGDCDK